MLDTETEKHSRVMAENGALRAELKSLRGKNAELRSVNQALRVALDAYVTRARSTPSFGSIEMSAGTSIGARLRRGRGRGGRET